MKTGQEYKGCRYWGFEPASGEGRHQNKAVAAQYKAEMATLKALGFRCRMGLNKMDAKNEAFQIERATGIEMWIFNHDYL